MWHSHILIVSEFAKFHETSRNSAGKSSERNNENHLELGVIITNIQSFFILFNSETSFNHILILFLQIYSIYWNFVDTHGCNCLEYDR